MKKMNVHRVNKILGALLQEVGMESHSKTMILILLSKPVQSIDVKMKDKSGDFTANILDMALIFCSQCANV